MEVILHSIKLGLLNMIIEKRNSLGLEVALLLSLLGIFGVQGVIKNITFFVEFQRFFWVDFFIVEFEYIILEIFENINF